MLRKIQITITPKQLLNTMDANGIAFFTEQDGTWRDEQQAKDICSGWLFARQAIKEFLENAV